MFGIKKTLVINSRISNKQYIGFIKTTKVLHSKGGIILVPFRVNGKLIGYSKWI